LFHEYDGDDFFVVTDAVKRRLAGPNKQAATPQYVKIPRPYGLSAKIMNIANNADPLSAIRALQLMRGPRGETSPTGS